MRRSQLLQASASVTFCKLAPGIELNVETGALGVVGEEVRFSSGESCSGVITAASSARATTRCISFTKLPNISWPIADHEKVDGLWSHLNILAANLAE